MSLHGGGLNIQVSCMGNKWCPGIRLRLATPLFNSVYIMHMYGRISTYVYAYVYTCIVRCTYRIVGYFRGGKFSRIELFLAFQGEIFTDCKEYLLKSKHFEGKIFTNCFRFMKIFSLENNPLYGSYMYQSNTFFQREFLWYISYKK